MTDGDILERCLAHDREAWTAFVDRFGGLVHAVIRRTLVRHDVRSTEDLGDDLFGAVFLSLYERDYRRLRQWDSRCSLASWIRLVTASVVVDHLRRRRPEVLWPDGAQPENSDARPLFTTTEDPAPALLERAEEIRAVRRALARIPAGDRALLERLFRDDLAPGVAAEELGVRPGAVYTRKNRALARLRAVLEEDPL